MDDRRHRDASNPELVEIIRRRIDDAGGRITFAAFMELALYHPEHGYYRTAPARASRGGDFITAPEAHPIFGQTLARQFGEMWRRLDRPAPFTLREYGAGAGTLALDVLEALRDAGDELLGAIHYEPVEINPARRAELTRRLEEAGLRDHLVQPEPGTRIVGCVLANEFLDALPVHRVVVQDGALHEVYVAWRDGWFADVMGSPSTPEIAARLEREGVTLAEGQRAEVCLGIRGWVDEVAAGLRRGYALVLDYGYPAAELYGPARSGGTLKAYFRHAVHEDPYRAVGEQDLTAHVDFSALQEAAEARGLVALGLTTQADFLAGAGIGELLVALGHRPGTTADEYQAARAAVMHLIDPGGMGRFRVLVLGAGVAPEPPLAGLSVTL
ncbi:MAG TPA: SAM-dependent methyltransferase [Thermomicrobiaceae bacterium]|nr:SAM-dependent methyltransferase [Thermomicrobiaceae bacterium]